MGLHLLGHQPNTLQPAYNLMARAMFLFSSPVTQTMTGAGLLELFHWAALERLEL
jgi:hypothetical protein